MVANFDNSTKQAIASRLIDGLSMIPESWALTPVLGNKRPYRTEWQNEPAISRRELVELISSGDNQSTKKGVNRVYPQGYGLRTGYLSEGILAIDADGEAPHKRLVQLGELPKTVSFTSGKPSRCQYLVRVPKEYWSIISTKKINTGVKGEDGKDQLLEFRWDGCQSVLPPSVHPETGLYKWVNSPQDCEIVQCPDWIIEYFLNESDANKPASLLTGDVPIYQCLTKVDRDLIDQGVGEGSRDDNGAKLARNLIGTAARLTYLGYRFEGDARQLFDDYCSRCSPPLSTKDADRIWKSAEKSNPSPSLPDNAIENCVKAWQRNQVSKKESKPASAKPSNVIQHPTAKKFLSGDEILKEIDSLIDASIGGAKLEAKIIDLAGISGRSTNEISRLYKSREQEDNDTFDREIATRKLPTLLEAQRAKLSPKQVLWGDGGKLAYLIQSVAKNMPISPEGLLTTLFPVAASQIGTSSRLIINPKSNYTLTCIIWSCLVGKTGDRKTPAQRAIINPLNTLESEAYDEWVKELREYEKIKGDEDKKAEKPTRRRFIVQGATTETRMRIHGENPRGLLLYRDEWTSFITGRNKYRAGKGDDAEVDLSEFNGDAVIKDVMDECKSVYLKRSAISRTGNTQPDVLKGFLGKGDFGDYAGEFARWLYCLKDNPKPLIDLFGDDDDSGKQLDNELGFLYRLLGKLPNQDYFLSTDAKRIYQTYQHQLMGWLAEEEHPGLAAALPKLQTYLGRFALWLHLVNAVLAGELTPHQFIDGHTMQVAVECTDFYLSQIRLLYALNSDQQAIAGNLLKIKEYIEKRPNGSTVRDIRSGVYCLRKISASEIEEDCKTLVSIGAIKQVSKKYFPILSKSDDDDDGLMINHHQPTTIENRGLHKNDDGDDQNIINFQESNKLDRYLMDDDDDDSLRTNHHQSSSVVETPTEQTSQSDDDASSPIITIIENTEVSSSDDSDTHQVSTAFKVGDKVAAADPYELKHKWIGEVKAIDGDDVIVYWPEREGTNVKPEEKHESSYLRLIE